MLALNIACVYSFWCRFPPVILQAASGNWSPWSRNHLKWPLCVMRGQMCGRFFAYFVCSAYYKKKNYGSSVLRCVFKLSLLRITRNCELVSNWLLHTGRHIFQPLVCKCIWVQSALARTADGRWESMMMDNKQRERLCAHHRIKIYTSPLEWNGTFFITTTSISVHIYLMQKLQNTNMIYMP